MIIKKVASLAIAAIVAVTSIPSFTVSASEGMAATVSKDRASVSSLAVSATGTTDTTVGMWYSTWYAKKGDQTWISNFGSGSTNQLMGDVNNDGKADAVYYSNGNWYVALSTGTSFGTPTLWRSGFGSDSSNQFIADVNGDGYADAITFLSDGRWYVALSNGSSFGTPSQWVSGHGYGSTSQMVGDVNGDGKADAVVFINNAGWYVATSNGSGFNPYTQWAPSGLGNNSSKQMLGDINGDGKLDAVAFYSTGKWDAATSNGTTFNTPSTWINGHGYGSTGQLLGDVDGDGKADAVVMNSSNGYWYVSYSKGSYFDPNYQRQWKNYGTGSSKQFLANTYGKDRDGLNCASYVDFFSNGTWQSRSRLFGEYNTWQAWDIKYTPYVNGVKQTYDSGDTKVIDEHLKMLADAKVDFLILDETNTLHVDHDYILNNAKIVADRIQAWNLDPNNRKIKFCIAVGGMNFVNDDLKVAGKLEEEAKEVYNTFVIPYGPSYYSFNGKPMLINYTDQRHKDIWTNYSGSKSDTGLFTLRWALNPCGAGNYGWQLPDTGAVNDDECMTVMPGWNCNNPNITPVSRSNGTYYSSKCWDKVIAKTPKPQMVVINSFNEYAEETAVAPTDTSNVTSPTEKWTNTSGVIDDNMYWNMTKSYIKQMKGLASVNFSNIQGLNQWYYQQYDGSNYTNMTWDSANNRWQGNQSYCLVMNNAQHPDTNDSVRKWVAPTSGTVTVKGSVSVPSSGGDGVSVKIKLNNNVVWSSDVTYGPGVSHNLSIYVNQGDAIYFMVNKKANNSFDTTLWDPSIYY